MTAAGRMHGSAYLLCAALIACVVLYLRWLEPSLAPYATGSDASGYLWSARLIRHGSLSAPVRSPDTFPTGEVGLDALAPLGASLRPGGAEIVPTYPPGFPLHIALAALVVPEEQAVRWTLRVAIAAALLVTYVLGRQAGLSVAWAAAGAAVLSCSPLFLFIAVQPFSDTVATCWAAASVLFAWRGRQSPWAAALAGACVGMATLVRPTNLLMVVPAAVALAASRDRTDSPPAISLSLAAAGLLPFLVAIVALQWWAFGHPLRTGYGDVGSAFSSAHVATTLAHYLRWLPALGSVLVVLAPGAWWSWGETQAATSVKPLRLALACWVAAILGLYAFYYHTAETWWYLRFVLPALPPLIVSGLVVCARIARVIAARLPRPASIAATMLIPVLVCGAVSVPLIRHPLFETYRDLNPSLRVPRDALRWWHLVAPHAATGAPLLTIELSGVVNYEMPQTPLIRFDRVSPDAWRAIRTWQTRTGTPVFAVLAPIDRAQFGIDANPVLPCAWQPRDSYRGISFWECPP